MEFKTIQEIRDHKWFGNHYSDHGTFRAIHMFVLTANNEEAREALDLLAIKGMGVSTIPYSDEDLDAERKTISKLYL